MSRVRVDATAGVDPRWTATDLAICAVACAGFVHLVLAPSHWDDWRAAGLFFAAVGLSQVALAWAQFRGRMKPRLMFIGVWGNVGVITIWVVSRTSGLPFAPAERPHDTHPGASQVFVSSIEAIGWLDMAALAGELVWISLMLRMMSGRHRQLSTGGIFTVGAALWILAVLGVLS